MHSLFFFFLQVSATDPDCGVNAMVNYTLGSGFRKLREFEVKSATGEVCISGDLDYELRTSYEFPIIATDRGEFLQKNFQLSFLNWARNFPQHFSCTFLAQKFLGYLKPTSMAQHLPLKVAIIMRHSLPWIAKELTFFAEISAFLIIV